MKNRTHTTIALFALCFAPFFAAMAAEYTVATNADDGEGSLRDLVAQATAGDTIFIPGSLGSIALESEIDLKTIQKPLRFVGLGEADARPVITGIGSHRTFILGRQIINGIHYKHEFHNLIFRDITSTQNGSAIIVDDWAPTGMIISNCLFEACSSTLRGAAIYLPRQDSWTEVVDCEFRNNSAPGGYVFYGGLIQMSRCLFEGNTAEKDSIFTTIGPALINDTIFTNNTAAAGGAIQVANAASNIYSRCTFVDNYASDIGGAIYTRNRIIFNDCSFLNNHAADGGGAIFRYNNSVELYNCLFEGNYTEGRSNWQGGGAFFCRDDGTSFCIVSNCIFRANYNLEANGVTGAIHQYGSRGTMSLYDTLFVDNEAKAQCGVMKITMATDFHNCVFQNNLCTNGVGAIYIGTGDLSYLDPEINDPRPVLFENCTFFENTSKTGRGLIWICNTKNQTVYFDENNKWISNLTTFQNENPDAPYTTVVADCLDDVTFHHCTIANNTTDSGCGILYIDNNAANSRIKLDSSIFYGNTSNNKTYDIQNYVQYIRNSALEQDDASLHILEPENSVHNWFGGSLGNPLFDTALADNASPITFLDGSHLPSLAFARKSPLRDQLPISLSTDARHLPRGTVSGLADIGAYEFQPLIPTFILVK